MDEPPAMPPGSTTRVPLPASHRSASGPATAAAGPGRDVPEPRGPRSPTATPHLARFRAGAPAVPLPLALALALAALLAGLPWALSLAPLGWQPGAPVAAPAQAGLSLALEGDTAPAVYEEGGPPIAVGSVEEARTFLRQLAPELATAGVEILSARAREHGFRVRRVELAQLLLTREGQLIARYDVWDTGGRRRPAWVRFARLTGRWQPLQVVFGPAR